MEEGEGEPLIKDALSSSSRPPEKRRRRSLSKTRRGGGKKISRRALLLLQFPFYLHLIFREGVSSLERWWWSIQDWIFFISR